MKRSFTLAQKGFIIVGLPLLFELALLITLNNVLIQTEREVENEMRARKITNIMNRFQTDYGNNVASVTGYFLGGGSGTNYLQQFHNGKMQIAQLFEHLSTLVPGSGDEQKTLANMKATSDEGIKGLEAILAQVKDRNIGAAISMFKELKPLIQNATHKMQEIIDEEEKIAQRSSEQQTRSRSTVKWVIVLGTILNLVLAVSLAIFFNRNLTSRLSTMLDNTLRLASKERLNKPVGGADEIANLDQVFHEMAEALENANKQKNDLLEMVAHDLRSPLMSIQTSLDLLTSTAFATTPEKAKSEAVTASKNVSRLIHLINDLLTLERMDAGQLKLDKKEVSLSWVTENAIDALDSYAKSKQIEITYPDQAPVVIADSDRLIQVLINLLTNSIKFSPEGSKIRISYGCKSNFTELRVEDSGRGIPEATRSKIFDRFEQVSQDDQKNGTGLGLAICKAIMIAHGGGIAVESKEGVGSTFCLTIPSANQTVAVTPQSYIED
jgi:signal transduction histidine kinase